MSLKTDYKDAIPPSTGRVYRHTYNTTDGTMTLEDVTEYEQVGDAFGAADINAVNEVANAAVPKVTAGVTGNLVAFAVSGEQADSGKKPSDFEPAMRHDSKTVTFASVPANGNAKASITAYPPSGYSIIAAICVGGSAYDNVICACNWKSNTLYVSAQSYWSAALTNVTVTIQLTYAKI